VGWGCLLDEQRLIFDQVFFLHDDTVLLEDFEEVKFEAVPDIKLGLSLGCEVLCFECPLFLL